MKKNALTLAVTLVAAGSIFAAVAYNGSQLAPPKGPGETPAQEAQRVQPEQSASVSRVLSQVAVQTTQAHRYQAQITSYAEAQPRYNLSFTSEVNGRVVSLADDFETGKVVKKGQILATLDNTQYQQAVASAEADVAAAKLAYLEEQREGEQAKSEWQRSGLSGEPSSTLVLREPQLESAKAALDNAEKALTAAKKDLEDTRIRAPFDALIVARSIQPGSYVSTGDSIATLYSVDRVEVELALSEQQWLTLQADGQSDVTQWQVTLTDSQSQHQWQARVDRANQHITETTRQRSVIAVVERPLEQASPLYPGTFVKATLTGPEVDNLWQIPASAYSQQGEVWMVNQQGSLVKAAATKRFERNNFVYIDPLSEEAAQVVMRPLSSFQVGMKVLANEEGES